MPSLSEDLIQVEGNDGEDSMGELMEDRWRKAKRDAGEFSCVSEYPGACFSLAGSLELTMKITKF